MGLRNPRGISPMVVLQDQKTASTSDGGTFTASGWRTRDLNTKAVDTLGLCTLSSNQFTLAAGVWRIRAVLPSLAVSYSAVRLQNVTDGLTVMYGTIGYGTNQNNGSQRFDIIDSQFTMVAGKALEIQHYCTTTGTTLGFGAGNSGIPTAFNIFSNVVLTREY
jgi:hypothetical protein